jgi:hypothetical protein
MIRSGGAGSGGIASEIIGPNRVQNGDMLISQRFEAGSHTVATADNKAVLDRWIWQFVTSTSSAADPAVKQQAASSGITGFTKSMLWTNSGTPSTTTPAALQLTARQAIEAPDVQDLALGTASASIITVSLWLKCSVANASIGVALTNAALNRSYPHICALTTAATWTYFQFSLTGDITGTWASTIGTVGINLRIALAGGATFQGTADTWQAGNLWTTSAQTQLTDTASSTLEITGVKLEKGAVATAFVPDPTEIAFSKAQRYYRKSFPTGTAPAQSAGVAGALVVNNPIALGQPGLYVAFDPPMYASPTIVTYNPSAGNANWRDVTAAGDIVVSVDPATALSTTGVNIATGGTVTNIADTLAIHYSADAGI